MKEDRKKEIEAQFLKLIAESSGKPERSQKPSLKAAKSAKVIRRRKGRPDLHIA